MSDTPATDDSSLKERPHLLWTAIALTVVGALGLAAYRIWSSPAATPPIPTDASTVAGAPTSSIPASPGVPSLGEVDAAIASGDLERARFLVQRIDEHQGWSTPLDAAMARIKLREEAALDEVHNVVVVVQGVGFPGGGKTTLQEVIVGGRTALKMPALTDESEVIERMLPTDGFQRAFSIRVTQRAGVLVRFVQPGGTFSSTKEVHHPVDLWPAIAAALRDPEGRGRTTSDGPPFAKVAIDRRDPELVVDQRPAPPDAAAPPGTLIAMAAEALERDDLALATQGVAGLEELDPGHGDLALLRSQLERLDARLTGGKTKVRLEVIQLVLEPREESKQWGELKATLLADGDSAGSTTGDDLRRTVFGMGLVEDPIEGNTIEAEVRGSVPLSLEIVDRTPIMRSKSVGTIDLGIRAADLPTGSGTLVVEHRPDVLFLQESDDQHVRRLVLRWTAER